ncbi:hypothetical protein NPIL_617921, partial [Nephila pilipes]
GISAGDMGRGEDTGVGGKGERGTGKSTSSKKSSKFIKSLMVTLLLTSSKE